METAVSTTIVGVIHIPRKIAISPLGHAFNVCI